MAIQPPPTAPPTPPAQQQAPPGTPQRSGCFGRGCGFGCAGCLIVVLVAIALTAGASYTFFVAQAQAAVNAPATLIVFNQPVTVNGNPGIAGESLNPGDNLTTGAGGHASIQFPDGSFVRLSPSTTVQLTAVQLQRSGQLQNASVLEKVGRTFTNVSHLASGATFSVNGHSVSAQVRGTQFEVLVRPDHTNRIWAFVGTVTIVGRTTIQLHAGQEIDADSGGTLSNLRNSSFDIQDDNPPSAQCSQAVSSGTTAGTGQTSPGDNLNAGQSAESDYYSSGGNVTMVFCYPGSLMSVTLTTPAGTVYTRTGAAPITIHVPNGPPGIYRAVVKAINVAPGGEPYAVSFATDAACVPGSVDNGSVVRYTLSNAQIAASLAQSGATGVTLQVIGTSPTSARIAYYSNYAGVQIGWDITFYAATPNLGANITSFTVHGVDVTTNLVSRINAAGLSTSSMPSGFIVDRVYSCAGSGGDTMMVIEGHH